MLEIGYTLSSEEHPPRELVRLANRAEEVGFEFAVISDHFHPWIDEQGHSPFVWSVLGGIAQSTKRIRLGTGVTCPLIRMHPAIVAQAAATAADMLQGRFFLGVGSGENLNEHITARRWPPIATRLAMLAEAIDVIRKLWTGENVTHHGRHFDVDGARIYSLPETPPPVYVAASGRRSVELAATSGDGLISTAPDAELVSRFDKTAGGNKPKYAQVHVCWAESEAQARSTAHRVWPNAALRGELGQELALPRHFEQAAKLVTEDDVASAVTCGPDPEKHLEAVRKFVEAGYDHVFIHQVGPDQEGFFAFFEQEVMPKLQ